MDCYKYIRFLWKIVYKLDILITLATLVLKYELFFNFNGVGFIETHREQPYMISFVIRFFYNI